MWSICACLHHSSEISVYISGNFRKNEIPEGVKWNIVIIALICISDIAISQISYVTCTFSAAIHCICSALTMGSTLGITKYLYMYNKNEFITKKAQNFLLFQYSFAAFLLFIVYHILFPARFETIYLRDTNPMQFYKWCTFSESDTAFDVMLVRI